MKAFIIDVSRCMGCYSCQIACKDEHCENDWMPYARPQPDTGQFWGKMNEYVRGNCPQVKMSYVFVPCQHCDDAACLSACPVEDGIYRRPDGLVIIDPGKCTGCRECVDACPYGSIYFNEKLNIAQKCTGCAHLLDQGGIFKVPRCVDVCGTGAIRFGEEDEFGELMEKVERLSPEYALHTRVYYLNLPRKFIAGTVYTPEDEEVVIGATCILRGEEGETYTQETNDWGDFWFRGLKEGSYTLTIEAGKKIKTITHIKTDKDVGLGDIALT